MAIDDRKVVRARAKSFDRERGPMVGLASFLMFFGGAALAGLGVATNLQPSLHPYLSQVAWLLPRIGLGGEDLLLVGVALASAGVVLSALRSFTRLLGTDRETGEAIEDLTRATTSQADCIEALESLIAVLRQETAEVHVVLREQAALLKRREENDPAFHIAASLDQVGARLERGIIDARDLLVDELHQIGSRSQGADDGPMLDGLDRVEGTLRELATLTMRFQQALDAAVQPMEPAASLATAEPAHVTPSWSDLEPRVSLERYSHPEEVERTHRDAPRWDTVEHTDDSAARQREAEVATSAAAADPGASLELPPLFFAAPPRFDRGVEGVPAELSIEVELDRAFVDASDEVVPAPLPTARPEGLDLLARLDSAHPLEMEDRLDTPPLFPDLEGRERG
jgi:hypothetical protein